MADNGYNKIDTCEVENQSVSFDIDKIGIYAIKSSVGHNLPQGLQEVTYIKSTGTQYLNTRLMAQTGYSASLKFTTRSGKSDQTVLGGSGNGNSGCIYMGCNYLSNFRSFYIGYNSTWHDIYYAMGVDTTYETVTNLGYNSQTVIVNGVTRLSTSNSIKSTSTTPLHLFYRYGGGYNASVELYYCTITDIESETKLREFVPCYTTREFEGYVNNNVVTASIGTVGLYDMVEGKLYLNCGSGTFGKGEDIN